MAGETQAQAATTEAQAATAATETGASTEPASDTKTFSQEYVSELRSEAAKYRKELQALKQQQEAAANATLSETEQLKKQLETLQKERDDVLASRRRDMLGRLIEKSAGKVGIDPELAAGLVKSDDLDIDDEDVTTKIEKRMRALLAKWPHLGKTPDVSATNGGTGSTKPPVTFTRTQLRDPAFYRKHEKEILLAQKEGRILDE